MGTALWQNPGQTLQASVLVYQAISAVAEAGFLWHDAEGSR